MGKEPKTIGDALQRGTLTPLEWFSTVPIFCESNGTFSEEKPTNMLGQSSGELKVRIKVPTSGGSSGGMSWQVKPGLNIVLGDDLRSTTNSGYVLWCLCTPLCRP